MQIRCLSLFLCTLIAAHCVLAEPATQPLTDEQKMQAWWDDLTKQDPDASRALLNFADRPEQAIAFFRQRLKPLIISEDEVNKLVADLASDDETVWKPAFEKLEYFDPRLAIDLPTLVNGTTEPVSRNRLIAVLCDYPAQNFDGRSIQLRKTGDHDEWNFSDGTGSWWAEARVDRLGRMENKKKWVQATRAIILLEHIATPSAIAILRDMSTGHPDAMPTKAAQQALEKIESADK